MEEYPKNLSLNQAGLDYARRLIKEGKTNADLYNWSENKPTPETENIFLAEHDMNKYGNWFLATVNDTKPDTKEHYEFPFGDFKRLFRSGLIAAKQRAGQFKHSSIENAAGMLLDILEAEQQS